MRIATTVLIFSFYATSAYADKAAADACKETLSPIGQQIYTATMAQNPTKDTARGIITKEVEGLISDDKVSMLQGRADGEAVGDCLKKLE